MKRRLAIITIVLALIFLAWLEFSWGQSNFTPGVVLVTFHPSTTEERIDEINQRLGTNILEKYTLGGRAYLYVIRIPEGQEEQMAGEYRRVPEVSVASPEYIRR